MFVNWAFLGKCPVSSVVCSEACIVRLGYLSNEFLLLRGFGHVADMLKKVVQSLLCVLLATAAVGVLAAPLSRQASGAQLHVILEQR